MRRLVVRVARSPLVLLVVLGAVAFSGWYAWKQPSAAVVGEVRVVLLPPDGGLPNALAETTSSLVSMASVVSRGVEGFAGAEAVDPTVTLASQGVRTGYSVRQPNLGGQWETSYQDPVVDVQSVGPTQEVAATEMSRGLAHVGQVLNDLQDREAVPADLRVRVRLSPPVPTYQVQKGSRTRGLAASAVAGSVIVGLWFSGRRATRPTHRRRDVVATAR